MCLHIEEKEEAASVFIVLVIFPIDVLGSKSWRSLLGLLFRLVWVGSGQV